MNRNHHSQNHNKQRSNPNQDFDSLNNNLIDDYSGNYYERSYQGWMSHTNEDMMNSSNYRSDGPGPVEIEARDKYIHNENFIKSFQGVGPKGYVRSDERIEEEVCEILARDGHIDASSIDVVVKNGIVKLSGSVRSRQEKFAIEDAVESISGITEMKNDIKVQKNYDAISYDF